MIVIPDVILLGASAILGLYLGWAYLRRLPRRPVLVGSHLLLGAAGLEIMVVLLRGTPSGQSLALGVVGALAISLTALALLSGLIAGLIARRSRRTADVTLATHAAVAVAGFGLFVAWAIKA
jgi:hypothetical protein